MKCLNVLARLCAGGLMLLSALTANAANTLPKISKHIGLFDNGSVTAETTITHLPDGRLVLHEQYRFHDWRPRVARRITSSSPARAARTSVPA